MGHPLLDQIAVFSRRALAALRLPPDGSRWGGGRLSASGIVCHYTADPNMARVLRWFCDAAQASRASAHFVVSDRREAFADGLMDDLPLVAALPVTVVQCRDIGQIAWHATVANTSCVGIEFVNVGELREAPGGGYVWWRPRDQSAPEWSTAYDGAPVVPAAGRYWVDYPAPQIACGQALIGALGMALDIDWGELVGHEGVQGVQTAGAGGHDKRDPGPLFPITPLREAMLQGQVGPLCPGAPAQAADADAPLSPELCTWWRAWAAAQTLSALPPVDEASGPEDAFRRACAGALSWREGMPQQTAIVVAKGILAQLGYRVVGLAQPSMTAVEQRSLKLFQRLMGLPADGKLGPLTHGALKRRYADRVVLPATAQV